MENDAYELDGSNWTLSSADQNKENPPNGPSETTLTKTDGHPNTPDFNVDMEVDMEDSDYDSNCCTRFMEKGEKIVASGYKTHHGSAGLILKIVFFLAYLVYFGFAMNYAFGDEGSIMLLVITIIVTLMAINRFLNATCSGISIPTGTIIMWVTEERYKQRRIFIRYLLYLAATIFVTVFLIVDILQYNPENLQAVAGLAVLVVISIFCSIKPSRINWHPVFWSFFIQFVFAYLVMRTDPGYDTFKWIGDAVSTFFTWSDQGGTFMWGPLYPQQQLGLAFTLTAMLVFFNAVICVLTNYGVIDFLVIKMGRALSLTLQTGPVESVVAGASIFIGAAEQNFLIRPYIDSFTMSELHAVLTCGFASIAGISMAIFLSFGVPSNHLMTAAVISAPAALAAAKIMYPETKKVDYSKQRDISVRDQTVKKGLITSIAEGAMAAAGVVAAMVATMMAFYSFVYMVNEILTWMGDRVGYHRNLTIEHICSYVLYPIAFLMGVDHDDCRLVGSLMGTKFVLTPIVAYQHLVRMIANRGKLTTYEAVHGQSWGWVDEEYIILYQTNERLLLGVMSERSEVISTYALCGFSAFTSIALCMGAMVRICPSRKDDIMKVIMRAFVAGNMASFFTGAVAGMMYT